MTNALIIVDVQNDFISGSLAVADGEMVAKEISRFLDHADYDHIVTTQDWHIDPGGHFADEPNYATTWPVHCRAATWGAELHVDIAGIPVSARFYKGHYTAAYSGFEGVATQINYELGLDNWLRERGVTKVDVCGIATDYCVKATAMDAVRLGFETILLHPLSAAVSPQTEDAALEEMRSVGVQVFPR